MSISVNLHTTTGPVLGMEIKTTNWTAGDIKQCLGRVQRQTPTRAINSFVSPDGAYTDLGDSQSGRQRVTHARRINGRLFLKIGFMNEVALLRPVSLESARNMDTMTVSP